MKYIKTYETLFKIYKENEPIETNSFTGDAILDVSKMVTSYRDIYDKYKFKLDDYVKYKGNVNWVDKDDVYQVKTIDIEKFAEFKKEKVYCIYSTTNDKFGVWVKQEDIIKATPEDIEEIESKLTANKFNL